MSATANDEYGFGTVVTVALTQFEGMQRASGRSARLVGRAQPGDIIVAADIKEAEHYRRLLRRAGKDQGIKVKVAAPGDPYKLAGEQARQLHFTHRYQLLDVERALKAAAEQRKAIAFQVTKQFDDMYRMAGLDHPDRVRLEYLDRG